MAIRKRGNSWQVDVTLNGERHRETFHTEAEAKAWELEARAAALQGRPIPRPAKAARNPDDASRRPRKASGGTLRDALEDAYDRFWKGGRSDAKVRVNAASFPSSRPRRARRTGPPSSPERSTGGVPASSRPSASSNASSASPYAARRQSETLLPSSRSSQASSWPNPSTRPKIARPICQSLAETHVMAFCLPLRRSCQAT